MKKNLAKIKEMNEKDLKSFVNEKKAKLTDFRFNLTSGKMKNVKPALKALPGICGTIRGKRPATASANMRSTRQRSSSG